MSTVTRRPAIGATATVVAAPLPFIHPDDMPDQYALTAIGTCMQPLIDDGATLVFDKREQPRGGDMVGLVFTPEAAARYGMPGWVKRLALDLPPPAWPGVTGLIIVEQMNPRRQYRFRSSEVLAVHKVIGTAEYDGRGLARFNPAKKERWQ